MSVTLFLKHIDFRKGVFYLEKYDNFIIHIPHASILFPEEFKLNEDYGEKEIVEESIYEADYMVDLFSSLKCNNVIKFPYSRLFCDVERYNDDNKEEMVKYGMGFIYEKDVNGRRISSHDNKYKKFILDNYYSRHHKKLDNVATKLIKKYGCCYIIDLHSFSDSYVYKLFKIEDTPDICIGFSNGFVDKELLVNTYNYFNSCGYSVKYNYPYEGSIVPNRYCNGGGNISSIMIEINKRVYLDYNLVLNVDGYIKLKECMDKYYKYLNSYVNGRSYDRI